MLAIFKFISFLLIALLLAIAGLVVLLIRRSTGSIAARQDEFGAPIADSIAEKAMVKINGVEQGMFIVGENSQNPVLLFLHGGPGSPEYIWFSQQLKPLEKLFTICYWDQRGAGMSYQFNMADFTVNDLVEDTRAVTIYLSQRFEQQQIYLLGHSWGTFLGVKTITRYPDLFKAYIGVAQISNQQQSELQTYNYIMQQTMQLNDQKNMDFFGKYDFTKPDFSLELAYMSKRNKLLEQYGLGMTREKISKRLMYKILFTFPGYTALEKVKIIFGAFKHFKLVWPPMILSGDLMTSNLEFQLPIYIIHGPYDYQVSYQLAKEYFDLIKAPRKEFFSFTDSAHTPFWDERGKFIDTIERIKAQVQADNAAVD